MYLSISERVPKAPGGGVGEQRYPWPSFSRLLALSKHPPAEHGGKGLLRRKTNVFQSKGGGPAPGTPRNSDDQNTGYYEVAMRPERKYGGC